MDLQLLNNIKIILGKFAKDDCFRTPWTLECVDHVQFSYTDCFRVVNNQAK